MQRKARVANCPVLAEPFRILGLIYVSQRDLPWPVNQKVLNITVQRRLQNPLPSDRSRFTISGARANNANPFHVLTKVHFYFGKYKQRDYFSNIQSCKKTCNLAETWSIRETIFHYCKIENFFLHLSTLLNIVAYIIRKTHKMTNKKKVLSTKSSPY